MAESQPVNISADKFAEVAEDSQIILNLAIVLIYQMMKIMSELKVKVRLLYVV